MNLLKETIEKLQAHGKTPADVQWCGSEEFGWFTWDEFAMRADMEYDDGYGAQEVASDLLIVGADFWLEREEYDGSEKWVFKTTPVRPRDHRRPLRVMGGMWETLRGLDSTNA